MSQPRNRRPTSRARESPRATAAPRAGYVRCDVKENYGNKNTYKIPKTIRYDLENALVGLCDVWFEEIKPYLVKNKLKLHTGGAVNDDLEPTREPRGSREEPRRAARLLDPGVADSPTGSQLQELLANAARSIESAVSQAALAAQTEAAKPNQLSYEEEKCWDMSRLRGSPNRILSVFVNRWDSPMIARWTAMHLPDDKRTRQPARTTPAPPQLTQTYQRNAHSLKQWMRSPVQEAPPRLSPPPLTRNQQHNHQTDHRTSEQGTTSKRKTRKSKRVRRKPQFPTSLSKQPQRKVSRPCCTACALAANAQSTNSPQRLLAATRLHLPRTKNTVPSKPLPDNKNANSKLYRLEVKIPRANYPTQQPTASAMPPRVARVTPAGDVPPSPQNAAEKCSFLHDASSIRNSYNRNKIKKHSANNAPFPLFERNMPVPLRAPNISPAGNVLPLPHVAAVNSRPSQDCTCIRNPIVRKPTQNHSSKFVRNWPSPANPSPYLHVATGDTPGSSKNIAGNRNPLDPARTTPMPPYFRRKSPCPLRAGGILPCPTHAKCTSPAQARSRSPVSLPVAILSPPPSEDETWFRRVFPEDTTQRRTRTRTMENLVPIKDALTSSGNITIPIHENNELQIEYERSLFAKDLIDLIGDKNDERLRVLYENPAIEERHPSVLNLVGSRNIKRKTAPKKMPWR